MTIHHEHRCRDGELGCHCYDAGYEAGEENKRLKNAGLYRQLFAEMNPERTFTAKELWKMFDDYAPLFTEEQKKELKDNLNSIMKKS